MLHIVTWHLTQNLSNRDVLQRCPLLNNVKHQPPTATYLHDTQSPTAIQMNKSQQLSMTKWYAETTSWQHPCYQSLKPSNMSVKTEPAKNQARVTYQTVKQHRTLETVVNETILHPGNPITNPNPIYRHYHVTTARITLDELHKYLIPSKWQWMFLLRPVPSILHLHPHKIKLDPM
jgi:hypothetical protein